MNGQKTIVSVILAALIAVLGTFAIFWFTIAGDRVNRQDVLDMISTSAPYVLDRGVLLSGMEDNTTAIDRLNQEMQLMKIDQARLLIKIDMLINIARDAP